MLNHRSKAARRAIALAAIAGLAVTGLAATGAGAQTGSDPGVSDKDVTIGYISSQTGVAAAVLRDAQDGGRSWRDTRSATAMSSIATTNTKGKAATHVSLTLSAPFSR